MINPAIYQSLFSGITLKVNEHGVIVSKPQIVFSIRHKGCYMEVYFCKTRDGYRKGGRYALYQAGGRYMPSADHKPVTDVQASIKESIKEVIKLGCSAKTMDEKKFLSILTAKLKTADNL